MPRINPETILIEEDAERNRRALAKSVEEIGRRLRPKNLATLAQHKISGKAFKSLGKVGSAVRSERGKIAVLAAGAIAAFYVGRSTRPRTRSDPRPAPHSADIEQRAGAALKERRLGFNLASEKTGVFAQNVKKLVAAAGAIATGYAIGSAAPISRPERELMGDASSKAKDYAEEFRRVHARGARIAAVQFLGVAQLAAAAIGLLGALAALVGDRGNARESSDAADLL